MKSMVELHIVPHSKASALQMHAVCSCSLLEHLVHNSFLLCREISGTVDSYICVNKGCKKMSHFSKLAIKWSIFNIFQNGQNWRNREINSFP